MTEVSPIGTADEEGGNEPRAGRGRWLRLAAWGVALLIFELTSDPSMVVVVGCSKFGWAQIRAALWMGRVDPDRRRGRACRWLYLSWGLWRISLAATLLMFALVFAIETILKRMAGPGNAPGGHPPTAFISAALLAFFGFLVSSLVAFLGLLSAWRGRVKVWVGPEAIAAREARLWPPHGPARSGNVAEKLILTAIPFVFVFFVFPWLAFGFVSLALLMKGQHARDASLAIGTMVAMIGGAAVMMILLEPIKARTIAAHPGECWPNEPYMPLPAG